MSAIKRELLPPDPSSSHMAHKRPCAAFLVALFVYKLQGVELRNVPRVMKELRSQFCPFDRTFSSCRIGLSIMQTYLLQMIIHICHLQNSSYATHCAFALLSVVKPWKDLEDSVEIQLVVMSKDIWKLPFGIWPLIFLAQYCLMLTGSGSPETQPGLQLHT